MFRVFNFLAFIGCIIWLFIDASPEPVVVLLMSIAAFFRDEIHGVIGKNIFSLTPKSKLVRDFELSKFSFINPNWINPRILEELCGWISDTGDQIVSININKSNNCNRYFGDISVKESSNESPIVVSKHSDGWFSYQYLGCSFSGVHILKTSANTGGSGIFCNIVMVTLSLDTSYEQVDSKGIKSNRFVIKLIGSLPLGDRYEGTPKFRWGVLTIPACTGLKTIRNTKSSTIIV